MTINANTNSVAAVMYSCLGGKFRIKLENNHALPGHRYGAVLDDNGNTIGHAYDYTYHGGGFAVHTDPYAGYVPLTQIDFID